MSSVVTCVIPGQIKFSWGANGHDITAAVHFNGNYRNDFYDDSLYVSRYVYLVQACRTIAMRITSWKKPPVEGHSTPR